MPKGNREAKKPKKDRPVEQPDSDKPASRPFVINKPAKKKS